VIRKQQSAVIARLLSWGVYDFPSLVKSAPDKRIIKGRPFIRGLRGSLHVTLEEGTCAAWLHDLLKPHVTQVLVCDPRKNAVVWRCFRRSGSRVSIHKRVRRRVCFGHPSLSINYIPPRTTRKSYRPRTSDRIMVGILQPHCFFVSEAEDVVTTAT
jgi:hypothetical protein